jgi:acetyltransferase-like isoleucine patch superfamily enzyme
LRIGQFVSIHRWCYIDAVGDITIGNDVSIAHSSSILSFDHTWADASRPIRDNPIRLAPVNIANDVWIGCGVRILAGVSIGQRCIVAAGAVVVNDVPNGTVAGGVPARRISSTVT